MYFYVNMFMQNIQSLILLFVAQLCNCSNQCRWPHQSGWSWHSVCCLSGHGILQWGWYPVWGEAFSTSRSILFIPILHGNEGRDVAHQLEIPILLL